MMRKKLQRRVLSALFTISATIVVVWLLNQQSKQSHWLWVRWHNVTSSVDVTSPVDVMSSVDKALSKKSPCSERINIGFLKTHKCASTTMQNILFRFGLRRNLTFVLPEKGNYLSREPLQEGDVDHLPWHSLGYNILALHTRWNHTAFARLLPPDTVYITVVREPVALFTSLYYYLRLDQWRPLEEFAAAGQLPRARLHGVMGQNQMLWDLGMPAHRWRYPDAVRRHVRLVERRFHLVLVAERLDESLVLLQRLLCWRVHDVVALPLNARVSSAADRVAPLSRNATAALRRWLAADYTLYRHMYERFERAVQLYGAAQMERDVRRLRRANREAVASCQITRPASGQQLDHQFRQLSERVHAYVPLNRSQACEDMARGELPFIDYLRQRQLNMSLTAAAAAAAD